MVERGPFSEAQLRRIDELCSLALELAPDRVRPFLLDRCPNDAAVCAEVERILSGVSDASIPWLDRPSEALRHGGEGESDVERPARIGRYAITGTLGEGGFGIVYDAEQTEPLHRRVALKLLKPGLATREVLGRFQAERRALTRMDHPGIARVLDAGESATGQPFIVMERVAGLPVTKFCEQERLSLEERLRLFGRVCEAVQHAHNKGIIHRDLKPSNILAFRDETGDAVKVIDFGIAKAITGDDGAQTLRTLGSTPLGTPAYMSPEQAGVGGQDVDARADVYSLGAVLYELVSGRRPFADELWGSRDYAAMQRVLAEVQPTSPSVRIAKSDAEEREVGRGLPETGELQRRLRGDLDRIVMHCLEKDPERRYQSVAQLASDVQRFLRQEPIEAAPPSTLYRAGKFVRRNRGGVLAAAAFLVILLGFSVAMSVAFVYALAARADADEALDLASDRAAALERENMRLSGLNHVLENLFSAPDNWQQAPVGVRASELRVRDVLEEASPRMGELFADQPGTLASLRYTLGRSFLSLEQLEPARRELELGLGVLEGRSEEFPADAARLARLEGNVLWSEQQYEESLTAYARGRAIAERHALGELTVANGNGESRALYHLERLDEAIEHARRIRDVAEAELGLTHPETGIALSNLGAILQKAGRLDEAVEVMNRSQEAYVAGGNDRHLAALILRGNIDVLLRALGRLDEMRQGSEALLVDRLDILGPTHTHTIHSMSGVAWDRMHVGATEGALELSARAVTSVREREDAPPLLVVQTLLRDANILRHAGDIQLAEVRLDELTPLAEEHFSAETFIRLETTILRAELLIDRGAFAEAAEVLGPLLEPAEPIENLQGMLRGRMLLQHARLEGQRGRLDSARAALAEARELIEARTPEENVFRREVERVAEGLR